MSDDEREALVAEARRHAEALINGTETGDADLLHDMAYALEAATTPSDDEREALKELLTSSQHAPMDTHSPIDGSCQECPWPLHALGPDEIADALLAAGYRRTRPLDRSDEHPPSPVSVEAVAEVVEHLLTMNFDDEPEGFVHRVSGALTQNIVARFALPAPVVTEELKVLRAQVAAVKRLCDETDIETHEATQAWLVGNIRAALTPEAGS